MPLKTVLRNIIISALCLVLLFQSTFFRLSVLGQNSENQITSVPQGYIGITSSEQLLSIKNGTADNYILMSNISFCDSDFSEGGAYYNDGNGFPCLGDFTGIFDGNGYSINNIEIHTSLFKTSTNIIQNLTVTYKYYDNSTGDDVQFYGLVGTNQGTVRNCTLRGELSFSCNNTSVYAAAVCNENYGVIESCSNDTDFSAKTDSGLILMGGIALRNYGEIQQSYNKGDIFVTATDKSVSAEIGGIAALSSVVKSCVNYGDICFEGNCDEIHIGGIAALAGNITNCLNIGNISLNGAYNGFVGGIASNAWNYNAIIANSCNYGDILSSDNVCAGGICGQNACEITDCYNKGTVSGGQCAGISGDSLAAVINCINLKTSGLPTENIITFGSDNTNNCYCFSERYTSVTSENNITFLNSSQINKPENYTGLDFINVWGFYYNLPYLKTINLPKTIMFESKSINLVKGCTVQNSLTSFIYPDCDLVFETQNSNVATVNSSCIVTGGKAGTSVVTVSDKLSGVSGTFTVLVDVSPEDYLVADTNDDRTVDVKDLIRLKKVSAGITTEYSKMNSDFNGDETINSLDLSVIRKILLGIPVDTLKDAESKITTLKTNQLVNPSGLDKTPEFSWITTSKIRAKSQSAYRVSVASAPEKLSNDNPDLWDSGKVLSDDTLHIKYEGSALQSSSTYYWTVRVWDEDGKCTTTPDIAKFTTGLIDEGWSDAKWIAPSDEYYDDGIAPLLRKEFTAKKTVAKAYAYATACGSYELYINGKRLGDSFLNPGCFSYNDSVLYQTYDITNMLNSGTNAVGAILGNGWFNFTGAVHEYGRNICFYGKVKLIYTDGTTEDIVTDTSWKATTEGPIRENDYYYGETYDATREMEGWNKAGFNDGSWLQVKTFKPENIIADGYNLGTVISETANISPVKNIKTICAQSVTKAASGAYVYDFNENVAGILSIKVSAPENSTMTVKVGETLDSDGLPNQTLFEGRSPTYTFISAGKTATFTASLNYCGMQYISISGVDRIEPEDVTLMVLSSATETSTFDCSNDLMNRYYTAEINSLLSNFVSNITDCPTREKNGWTGDAQITSKTAGYMINSYYSYVNFMRMMREAQYSEGTTAFILPARDKFDYQKDRETLASGWCDSVVIIPWQMYNQYGDISIIEDNYSAMAKWVDYLDQTCKSNGYIRTEGSQYGDHMHYNQSTDYNVIGTAYSAYSADLLSRMARILGKTADADKYNTIYNSFRSAWQTLAISADGATLKTETQTAYAMGLYFELFNKDKAAAAAQNLSDLMYRDGHQTCGYVGIGLLYDALIDNGQADTAFAFYEKTGTPSLLDHIATGSSTIWETYFGGSHNHHVLGAPAQCLISKVAGITNGETGGAYKNFVLKPNFGNLTYGGATINTNRGIIASNWRLTGKTGYTYNCTVPVNTIATLYLPLGNNSSALIQEGGKSTATVKGLAHLRNENGYAVYEVKSGTYNFAISYN